MFEYPSVMTCVRKFIHKEKKDVICNMRFEKAVAKYDKNPNSELLELSDEITSETASTYTEIGLQVGMLLMKDMLENIGRERKEETCVRKIQLFLI